MKTYHWILLVLTALIGWIIWAISTIPIMTINGVPVDLEYDVLQEELLAQPHAEANAEGAPIVYMGDYKFALDRSWASVMLKSIDSLSRQEYQAVIDLIANEYKLKPILKGRDSFCKLYNKERDLIRDYNQNTEAFSSIIGIATDYGDGVLFEIDKHNYIFVGYTSNWYANHVHICYYVF
jgi:hypothetical protein